MEPEGELDCNQLETLHSEAGKHNYIASCILVFALFLGALKKTIIDRGNFKSFPYTFDNLEYKEIVCKANVSCKINT